MRKTPGFDPGFFLFTAFADGFRHSGIVTKTAAFPRASRSTTPGFLSPQEPAFDPPERLKGAHPPGALLLFLLQAGPAYSQK